MVTKAAKVQNSHNLQNKSFLFLHRESKATDFLAEAIILAVGIGQGFGVIELKRARALVNEFLLSIDGHHLGDEHVVRTQFLHLHNLALDAQG